MPPIRTLAVLSVLVLLCGCRPETSGDSPASGKAYSFTAMPSAGEQIDTQDWELLASSVRSRLETLGVGEMKLSPGSLPSQIIVDFQGKEVSAQIIREAFAVSGTLEVRRFHLRSSHLSGDFKALQEAGQEWTTLTDRKGGVHVIGRKQIVTPGHIAGATTFQAGDGWNLRIQFTPKGESAFRTAFASLKSRPLAIVVDGKVAIAPLAADDWKGGELTLPTQLSEDAARGLAFALSAPLLYPVQVEVPR